jgi:RimJ/RimL family protein N-acetyltransferase
MLSAVKHFAVRVLPRWLPWLGHQISDSSACSRGWTREVRLQDGRGVFIRPLCPDDEALYPSFLDRVTAEDRRLRFFVAVKELSPASIARFTHFDYTRAMAFAALDRATGDLIGVARLHRLPQGNTAEFAILVRSDLKGHGLGWFLMNILIEYARRRGLSAIEGDVLPENEMMLKMCTELGFRIGKNPADASLVSVRLQLDKSRTILPKLFRGN